MRAAQLRLGQPHAELFITIGDKRFWGEGYGSDAVWLLLELAFGRLDLHSVNLTTHATNQRAIRCYEKCGFAREGLFRERTFIRGAYIDVVAMGVLRVEYEERRTAART